MAPGDATARNSITCLRQSSRRYGRPVTYSTPVNVEFGRPQLFARRQRLLSGVASISRDGERVVAAAPLPQSVNSSRSDRQGKVVSTAGQPGTSSLVPRPMERAVVMKNDPQTGTRDIWTAIWAVGKPRRSRATLRLTMRRSVPRRKQVAYVSTPARELRRHLSEECGWNW